MSEAILSDSVRYLMAMLQEKLSPKGGTLISKSVYITLYNFFIFI